MYREAITVRVRRSYLLQLELKIVYHGGLCVCIHVFVSTVCAASYLQGLYGALFIKLNLLWTRLRKKRFRRFPLPLIEVSPSPTCSVQMCMYITFIWSSHVHVYTCMYMHNMCHTQIQRN